MGPLLAMLFQNGLGVLGNAVVEKGQKAVEEKLGVKLAPSLPLVTLKQLEFQHEEWLVTATQQAKVAEAAQVTDRWKSDMGSDSWLSKNVRPLVLLSILGLFAVLSAFSAFGYKVDAGCLSLLKEWGMLSLGAYFGGRSFEKVTSIKTGGKG